MRRLLGWLKKNWSDHPPLPSPPLMRIVNRTPDGPGSEIAALECGHRVHLYHHQLSEIPCRACQETGWGKQPV